MTTQFITLTDPDSIEPGSKIYLNPSFIVCMERVPDAIYAGRTKIYLNGCTADVLETLAEIATLVNALGDKA